MFAELVPLLTGRVVMLTMSAVDEHTLIVNVVPKQIATSENAALATPLSITASPAELDATFPRLLHEYATAHIAMGHTLAEAKSLMDAAAKAAQDEARKKVKGGKSVGSTAAVTATATNGKTVATPATPTEAANITASPATGREPDLFSAPTSPPTSPASGRPSAPLPAVPDGHQSFSAREADVSALLDADDVAETGETDADDETLDHEDATATEGIAR